MYAIHSEAADAGLGGGNGGRHRQGQREWGQRKQSEWSKEIQWQGVSDAEFEADRTRSAMVVQWSATRGKPSNFVRAKS